MAITYYKRFRMEIDLDGSLLPPLVAPPFWWVAWDESLVERHAEVKYLCFRDEIDSHVFPCLGEPHGCQRLMREIRRKPGFLAVSTWLIASPDGYCGTVQGVMDRGPDRRDPEPRGRARIPGDGPGPGPGPPGPRRVLPGGPPPGLPRSHRREHLGGPALSGRRLPDDRRRCTRRWTAERGRRAVDDEGLGDTGGPSSRRSPRNARSTPKR